MLTMEPNKHYSVIVEGRSPAVFQARFLGWEPVDQSSRAAQFDNGVSVVVDDRSRIYVEMVNNCAFCEAIGADLSKPCPMSSVDEIGLAV